MYVLQNLKSFFDVVANKPDLNRARYDALSRQIPLMYVILIVDMFALGYSHANYAPLWICYLLPAILTPVTIFRSIQILKTDNDTLSDAVIRKRLLTINYLAAILGTSCIVWALTLFEYGNAYTQGHTAFFICLTAVAVITSLMHLRQASIIIFATVVCPAIIYFLMGSEPVFHAIAINILLVTGIMQFIMFRYYNDFKDLIEQQTMLKDQRKILKILSSENLRLANLDSLTGLPNRRCYFSELTKAIESHEAKKTPFIVGILDLDGFKQINDLFGHPTGDELLIDASNRLREMLPSNVFIARLGGDEFGLIITDPGAEDDLMRLGNEICQSLKVPFKMKEGSAQVAGTLGFASYPTAGETPEILFERADYALCYSKQNSKGQVVMFSEEHETIIREVSTIAHRMREADLNEELSVWYQPIVNAANGQTIAFEALARWSSPVLGNIPPNVFIRSAEQSGMISQLTTILLTKSLKQLKKWPEDTHLSFNLSTFDLCSPESILKIIYIVEKSGVAANRITFEITESAVMQDYNRAINGLDLLRNMGAKIALDDFGTGFSSLSYIQRLPIDRLKVDREFILDIVTNKATRGIVQTIADLCRNLDMECVIEGVETKEQLDILIDMGFELIQGYYFSKPLPKDEALTYIEAENQQQAPKQANA